MTSQSLNSPRPSGLLEIGARRMRYVLAIGTALTAVTLLFAWFVSI
jgi:hypothetical protein